MEQVRCRLEQVKGKLLSKVEISAKESNIGEVKKWTTLAEECENKLKELAGIANYLR
tara:strand:- start:2778 stop:2948 length:171 start_codon:yes stop_codon:yes gene_type:complete